MAAFTGEIITASKEVATQSTDSEARIIDWNSGVQVIVAGARLTALASSGINPIPRYKLSCEDNTGLRHYWVDFYKSLTNAPDGFTYVSATFVVEGQY